MEMIDSLEKKESKLDSMLKTVIRDKRKISQTILKLNKYMLSNVDASLVSSFLSFPRMSEREDLDICANSLCFW